MSAVPRIPVHTVENAPDASRDTLAALERRVGKVLNIYGELDLPPAPSLPVAETSE